MYALLTAFATVWPAPKATTSPRMVCPKIQLIQINLAHKIDKGVYFRTRKHCSKLYKKSPCLVKLEQIKTGAFNVTCGEKIAVLLDTPDDAVEGTTAEETEEAACRISPELSHPISPSLSHPISG